MSASGARREHGLDVELGLGGAGSRGATAAECLLGDLVVIWLGSIP